MKKLSVRDLKPEGKRVFCRVDFNVPMENGSVTDDRRIAASLPTIRLLMDQGARVVLASHLGRPKGKPKPELSLAPCAEHLGRLLGKTVVFAPDCIGDAAETPCRLMKPGTSCSSRTSASTGKRRTTTPPSPRRWRAWPTST